MSPWRTPFWPAARSHNGGRGNAWPTEAAKGWLPGPAVILGSAPRRRGGAKALDGRELLHPPPPLLDRRKVRVHGLRFGSECKGVSAGQQVIICETHLTAEQKALAVRQLALH